MTCRRSWVQIAVHIVWGTKYKRRIIAEDADDWLKRVFTTKCFEAGCRPLEIGMDWDHVHVAAALGPTTAISQLVMRMKGASSRLWNITRRPRLTWQDGYWAESVSPRDLARLCAYIRNQRDHHRLSHAPERWTSELAEWVEE